MIVKSLRIKTCMMNLIAIVWLGISCGTGYEQPGSNFSFEDIGSDLLVKTVVVQDGVYLMTGPRADREKTQELARFSEVELLKKVVDNKYDGNWYLVKAAQGQTGYLTYDNIDVSAAHSSGSYLLVGNKDTQWHKDGQTGTIKAGSLAQIRYTTWHFGWLTDGSFVDLADTVPFLSNIVGKADMDALVLPDSGEASGNPFDAASMFHMPPGTRLRLVGVPDTSKGSGWAFENPVIFIAGDGKMVVMSTSQPLFAVRSIYDKLYGIRFDPGDPGSDGSFRIEAWRPDASAILSQSDQITGNVEDMFLLNEESYQESPHKRLVVTFDRYIPPRDGDNDETGSEDNEGESDEHDYDPTDETAAPVWGEGSASLQEVFDLDPQDTSLYASGPVILNFDITGNDPEIFVRTLYFHQDPAFNPDNHDLLGQIHGEITYGFNGSTESSSTTVAFSYEASQNQDFSYMASTSGSWTFEVSGSDENLPPIEDIHDFTRWLYTRFGKFSNAETLETELTPFRYYEK